MPPIRQGLTQGLFFSRNLGEGEVEHVPRPGRCSIIEFIDTLSVLADGFSLEFE